MRLKGQTIWITGSAKRVGRALALGCAKEGADIVVHCHKSRAEAERVAKEIRKLKRRAMVVQGDHGVSADVVRMVAEIKKEFGGLTALINSASVFPRKDFESISEEDFFGVIRSNVYGQFLCAQKSVTLLRRAKPGRIINITDASLKCPAAHYAHYFAAKGGLAALTKALAKELAPKILVNAIAPGRTIPAPDETGTMQKKLVERVPLKRWGGTEEILKAALFLLESEYATGETIAVDGGLSIS
ncbi:3-oxoacyl-ACP reductase FabG [soil metagenome]